MKGMPGGRTIDIPPAPRALSMEDKLELLKSAGLGTLDEKPTPYLTLAPQQPYVAGRGSLLLWTAAVVDTDKNYAYWNSEHLKNGWLIVHLNFETKGIYLMTLTVSSYSLDKTPEAPEFVVLTFADHTTQKFIAKMETKSWMSEWLYLNMIVEVPKPGAYGFSLYLEGKPENDYNWSFHSCEVTAWKK